MSARKGWQILVTVGRECQESQPNFEGGDECYIEREFVKRMVFAASADRVVRALVRSLKALGFKQRGREVSSTRDAPQTDISQTRQE